MAVRIVGVDLPQNKQGEIALTYIYGQTSRQEVCTTYVGRRRPLE